jgi:hypothetical protein
LPGWCKILIWTPTRQVPSYQEALISGTRTQLIKLRRPQSLRRSRRSTWREEEKLEETNRVTMAEWASLFLNVYSRRKSQRKSRCNAESA